MELTVLAVAEMLPEGQYVTAAAVLYDRPLSSAALSPAAFEVEGRKITRVYTASEPVRSARCSEGKTVLLELSTAGYAGKTIPEPERPRGPRPIGEHKGPPHIPQAVRIPPAVTVKQREPLTALDGSVLLPWAKAETSQKALQPLVELFSQHEFKGIPYNLFVPENYDPNKKYPLVQFIHDAGPNGSDPLLALTQGVGGVVWADPKEQEKRPCFVVCPQIPKEIHLTRDSFQTAPELTVLKELLDDIISRYSIDPDRVYTTGQSQGCMASCELNVRYPDFFAASLLVAGQWNPETMAEKLARHKFWILVSRGDEKAFPGMNAVTEALEKAGARVGRYVWDAKAAPEALNEEAHAAMADGCNVHYTVFKDHSVVPEGVYPDPGANHVNTWPVAYSIPALREWLFKQKRGS